MGNCLVTKLKGVVDNDNLLKFGEAKIPVANCQGFNIRFDNVTPENPTYVKGLGKVRLNGGTEILITTQNWVSDNVISGLDDGEVGYIIIGDKYRLRNIECAIMITDGDVSPFKYMKLKSFDSIPSIPLSLAAATLDRANYKLSDLISALRLNSSELVLFGTLGKNVEGDLSELLVFKNSLTTLRGRGAYYASNKLTGDFGTFGHLYKVTDIGFLFADWRGITGSIEDFVAARLEEVPNTAGSVACNWLGDGGRLTWEGAVITNVADNTIAWDAQGNITVNGQSHNPNA